MVKPKILLSECFLEACRYNGAKIQDDFVLKLLKYVDYETVCPEVSVGLGIPRDPIVIQQTKNGLKLIQPNTGFDLTDKMNHFAKDFVRHLDIDGAILKSKSPSCGVYTAKYFLENNNIIKRGPGFFAKEIIEKFEYLPIEEEKRLLDEGLRYNFLVRIFSIADLKANLKQVSYYKDIIEFHTKYKFLLMYYNQSIMRNIGRFLANSSKLDLNIVRESYIYMFLKALSSKPKRVNHINVIQHMFGYFSKKITPREKRHFMEVLRLFKEYKLNLYTILEFLKSFALRFEEQYILTQSYLEPFPRDLI